MGAFSWAHILVLLIIVGVIVALLVLAARSWRRRGIDPTIGLTLTVSALAALFGVVAAIIVLVGSLMDTQLHITIPVSPFWPTLPPGTTISGTTATLAQGGFVEADVWVEGASSGARVLWGIGQALGALVPAAIAGLIAVACFQLLRGAAFAPVVARMAMITAVVVLVGGMASGIMSDIAGSMVSHELLAWTGATGGTGDPNDDPLQNWPMATSSFTLPLWPIGAGLGFAALAAILRYGTRLQKDTEGLV
ncbi:hypothetical protein [Microbacterium candidum]|uniref:Uncharacterized protein n=1 Tax=Microbacterium candidum TaxID=3041922 RepID=A0ABT7MV14_9MICO|nr:hypothetical protein [Microbacterium sp. ASV49]MDL9978292.1 hypothetical protein [Microbacterium sp. ASV49]